MKRSVVGLALVALLVGIPAAAAAQSTRPSSAGPAADRRGDVAFGYAFVHEDGLSLPAGFILSDAWRMNRNFDVVVETGFNHGSVQGVGVNLFTVSGGVRSSIATPNAAGMSAFGQVLMGLSRASASALGQSVSVNGFNIQPGFGVEVPVKNRWGIRPQFDVLIQRMSGDWGSDIRFGVSAVYRMPSAK